MYESFFGFAEKPFGLTPDPRYLYRSASHADALELLQYAVAQREGFTVVTGDIGTGKTTVCRALLEQLEPSTCVSLLLNPFLSEEELLMCILRDFGVVSRTFQPWRGRTPSRQDLIEVLHQFLRSLIPLGARAVVIVDEAQNLPIKVLEQMRILSNLETSRVKLLQIVLFGQQNLSPLLASPDLRQLEQRISVRFELEPLRTFEEVAGYIAHRLAIASAVRPPVFTQRALALIHRYSAGTPRIINLLCDRALTAAYAAHLQTIDADVIRVVGLDLQLRSARDHAEPRSWLGRVQHAFTRQPAAAVSW